MARWQCRKEAAEARMRNRRGVTPESEVKAGLSQYRNDLEQSAELEGLKAKLAERTGKAKPKGKPEPTKVKPDKKPMAKPVPKVKEPVSKAKGDPFTKDFYDEIDD